MTSQIAQLNDFGQSPWCDNLTRTLARDGGLQRLVTEDGIRGVTSNPTIFEKAMAAGEGYDEQLRETKAAGLDVTAAYWALVRDDIARAAGVLRPVYDATHGDDGYVSVEVSPVFAEDVDDTIAQAKELFSSIGCPNVMIKIPATEVSLPAITAAIGAGINVNVTLIFSLERHRAVIDAYFAGLEQLAAAGGDVASIASVASFFVSRVDTETDRRLPAESPRRGKAGIANAKLAYALFEERFRGERWDALAAAGARKQRPLWASTSTKNPDYPPTMYVDELIGRDTVNTLAPASVDALHAGQATLRADTVREDVEGARAVIEHLADDGVDFADVTALLEREGVDSFTASFRDALETLEKRRAQL